MDIKMDTTKIQNSISKLDMYNGSQKNNMISLKTRMKRLLSVYSSSNKNLLNDKVYSITKKFEVFNRINRNHVYIVNRNISTYLKTEKLVSKKFDDII